MVPAQYESYVSDWIFQTYVIDGTKEKTYICIAFGEQPMCPFAGW